MLHYAVVFFVVALIASVLGFNGVAGLSAEIGWLFAVLALVFLAVTQQNNQKKTNNTTPKQKATIGVFRLQGAKAPCPHGRWLVSASRGPSSGSSTSYRR